MTDGGKPRLIVVAGPNGSGKTSITQQLLMHEWMDGCTYVNPDFIARDEFGDWNAPDAVIQAAQRAAVIREGCLTENRSLAFETVLSAPDKMDFIRRARDAGFFIRVFFVGTDDPSINAKRVAMRVMEGGHDVPIPKIIGRYTKSLAYCSVAAWLADRTYVYDNSIDNARAALLFRASKGRLVKVYGEINPWAREITRRLLPVQTDEIAS
ncbi:MAG: zeta toxin family protein [Candidatus Competibacteraceae bacterium]|nr:zeta toxin family protein [Candidatus Competibacteraceae bacterium]MBK7983155.1 zeta toxin family protein [Candidatus Competibacteraceae bacterium]MBK8898298.1 zeta toxin family protein [Candidatus Competibacteraceae bacterium]MBK8962104.1 zeta toxin family protein [Candidatus Competibacteraceae bacterium]MBK9951317.1 zeta toxin family protein [Candidatus Competibacteraceae bacterium]